MIGFVWLKDTTKRTKDVPLSPPKLKSFICGAVGERIAGSEEIVAGCCRIFFLASCMWDIHHGH